MVNDVSLSQTNTLLGYNQFGGNPPKNQSKKPTTQNKKVSKPLKKNTK